MSYAQSIQELPVPLDNEVHDISMFGQRVRQLDAIYAEQS